MSKENSTIKTEERSVKESTLRKVKNKERRRMNKTMFEKQSNDLQGYIYRTPNEKKPESFTKTTEAVADYIQRVFKHGGLASQAIRKIKEEEVKRPEPIKGDADVVSKAIFQEEMKMYWKEKIKYKRDMEMAYSIIIGQCSENMLVALKSHEKYANAKENIDTIGLLKCTSEICYNHEAHLYKMMVKYEAKKRFFLFHQRKQVSCQKYLEDFNTMVEALETLGVEVADDEDLITYGIQEMEKLALKTEILTLDRAKAKEIGKNAFLAMAFLSGADRSRYGELMRDLENSYTRGLDKYPRNIVDAFYYLLRFKGPP